MTDKKDKTFLDYKPSSRFFAKIREAIDKIDKREIKYRIGQAFVDEAKSGSEAWTELEKRFQLYINMMKLSCGKGIQYSGPVDISNSWEVRDKYVIPRSGKIWDGGIEGSSKEPSWGFSCGHAMFDLFSYIANDLERRTWRSGRQASYLYRFDGKKGKKVKGRTLRGYKKFFTPVVGKWKRGNELGSWLYENVDKLGRFNIIEMSHHTIAVIVPDSGFSFKDPNTGEFVKQGVPYRCGSDGNYKRANGVKYYSGKPYVFRTFKTNETTSQRWKLYKFDDSLIDFNKPMAPLVLQGLEDVVGIPTKKGLKKLA